MFNVLEDVKESENENYDECNYECKSSGGCQVQYTGPPRGGPTVGSCFPPLFGSSCTGTPPECSDCNKVLNCSKQEDEESSTAAPVGEVCDYQCQDSGGCQVFYVGPPRGGNTLGSCFPALFGGTCDGTPSECEDCNKKIKCEEDGPEYEDYDADETGATNDILNMPDGEPCIYLCNDDGGCTVRYAGPPQSGSTVGEYWT